MSIQKGFPGKNFFLSLIVCLYGLAIQRFSLFLRLNREGFLFYRSGIFLQSPGRVFKTLQNKPVPYTIPF